MTEIHCLPALEAEIQLSAELAPELAPEPAEAESLFFASLLAIFGVP